MKTGKTLPDLEAELKRQCAAKRDFLAPARLLNVRSNGHTDLDWQGSEQPYPLHANAHSQIAQYVGIPQAFYEFLRTRAETLRVPVSLSPTVPNLGEAVDPESVAAM